MAEYIDREALMKNFCGYDLTKCVKYGNKDADQQHDSYSTMMMYEIASEIEDAPAADVATVLHGEWIPVTERLPEKNKEVVGWYKDNPFSPFRYGIVSWNGHGWVFTYAQRYVDAVTYWMPLPEPPKEERP